MIDAGTLRNLLDYDPLTGHLIWRVNRGTRAKAGQIAGALDPQGYIIVGVNKRYYLAHRLAYLHQMGEWPSLEMDHINGDKADNSWANLRLATSAQNKANRPKYRGVMPKGVSKSGNKFVALITVNYKQKYLGIFASAELAHAAYCEAAQQAFGAYHRAG